MATTTIHKPGNGGRINVRMPSGGTSVRNLRDSLDIPDSKYAFVSHKGDGSLVELDDDDIVSAGESISLIAEHVAGYVSVHLAFIQS